MKVSEYLTALRGYIRSGLSEEMLIWPRRALIVSREPAGRVGVRRRRLRVRLAPSHDDLLDHRSPLDDTLTRTRVRALGGAITHAPRVRPGSLARRATIARSLCDGRR